MRVLFCCRTGLAGLLLIAAVHVLSTPSVAQPSDAAALVRQIGELQRAGRHAEALPIAERLVALTRARFGDASVEHASALETLASSYTFQSRFIEAEPIYGRVLAIREKVSGSTHESVLAVLGRLAEIYRFSNQPGRAEPLLQRVLRAQEQTLGFEHPSLINTLGTLARIEAALRRFDAATTHINRALALAEKLKQGPTQIAELLAILAQIEREQGRLEAAAAAMQRALSLHEQETGKSRPDPAAQLAHMLALMQMGALSQQMERYDDASRLMERLLGMTEKLLGPDHPNVASALEAVASTYGFQGRYAEAEALRKRAITINERAYGNEHASVALSLQGLGHLYRLQDRYEEALPLLTSALRIAGKSLGPEHPMLSVHLAELGDLHRSLKQYDAAEPLLKRALAILEKASGFDQGLAAAQTIRILQSLAFLQQSRGRIAEAVPLIERAAALSERAFGGEHILTGSMVSSLGILLLDLERIDEAEQLFERALPISTRTGPDSLNYADNVTGLGIVHFRRRDWDKALTALRRASAIYVGLGQRATGGKGGPARGGTAGGAVSHADVFLLHAVTAYRLAEADNTAADTLRDEAFQLAQRSQSSQAGGALSQMAARFSQGKGTLSELVRERQDRTSEWQALDRRLTTALSALPNQRDAAGEQALRQRLAHVSSKLDVIDKRLAQEFPEYAALADPQPLSIERTRALLAPDEALILIASRPNQSLVWAVTREAVRWSLIPLGEHELSSEVAALRCGLDAAAWQVEDGARCKSALNTSWQAGEPLPFPLARAHELHRTLLAPFQEVIKSKQILLALSGPLATLPFAVLVTEPPVHAQGTAKGIPDYAAVAWLAKRHALTTLPSVASLASLRTVAKASTAPNPFIGFGNPLLAGFDGTDRTAWAKQTCPKPSAPQRDPALVALRRAPPAYAKLIRGKSAAAETLRHQTPLPETADELCAVGSDLAASERDVYLGSRATENAVKALSAKGVLATYRVVHFATHGLLAGETEQLGFDAEPALLLTPPQQPTEADDGLLTASEVAQLKLDAEWIVLSACNTAGADKGGGEALSGLARAFFYAGARSLLVSHWYVDSDAAVKLVTGTFAELRRNPGAGRAEALRRSMLTFMAGNGVGHGPMAGHPSVWAPFVVGGEPSGAAR